MKQEEYITDEFLEANGFVIDGVDYWFTQWRLNNSKILFRRVDGKVFGTIGFDLDGFFLAISRKIFLKTELKIILDTICQPMKK
jgi:hypothetical protein